MRKIYKKPFWKSYRINAFGMPFLLGLLYSIFMYANDLIFHNWVGGDLVALSVCLILLGVMFYYGLFLPCFYLQIGQDTICLRSFILPFYNKTYQFSNIISCRIEYYAGPHANYIDFISMNGEKSMKCGLDMVSDEDLKEIISILESKGIEVVTRNLKV